MSPELEADLRRRFADMLAPSVPLDLPDAWYPDVERALNSIRWAAKTHDVHVVEIKLTAHGSAGLLTIHARAPNAPADIQQAVSRAARKARWGSRRLPNKALIAVAVKEHVTAAVAGRKIDEVPGDVQVALYYLTPDTADAYGLSPSAVSHYLNLKKSPK